MLRNYNLHQVDRVVIAAIGLLSILSDGWLSDVFVMLSMLLWLWLPEWEKVLLKVYIKGNKSSGKVN